MSSAAPGSPTGGQFRACDFRGAKIVDSWLTDVNVSGLIAPLVDAELDRRHPERVQLRAVSSPGPRSTKAAALCRL